MGVGKFVLLQVLATLDDESFRIHKEAAASGFVGGQSRIHYGRHEKVGDADTRTSHYAKPVRHASYLLVSDVAAVGRFEVMTKPEVSDHRALILDI